jgi:hypothetical protein
VDFSRFLNSDPLFYDDFRASKVAPPRECLGMSTNRAVGLSSLEGCGGSTSQGDTVWVDVHFAPAVSNWDGWLGKGKQHCPITNWQ